MGGKGGGGNNASQQAQEMAAQSGKQLSDLAVQLSSEAAPWRQAAGGAYMSMLNDPWKATASSQNALTRGASQQMAAAEQMSPGGARDAAMRQTKMSELTGKAQLLNQGYQAAAQALGNLGLGQSQAGISGFQGANQSAQTLAKIGSDQASQKGQGAAGFGALLGGMI